MSQAPAPPAPPPPPSDGHGTSNAASPGVDPGAACKAKPGASLVAVIISAFAVVVSGLSAGIAYRAASLQHQDNQSLQSLTARFEASKLDLTNRVEGAKLETQRLSVSFEIGKWILEQIDKNDDLGAVQLLDSAAKQGLDGQVIKILSSVVRSRTSKEALKVRTSNIERSALEQQIVRLAQNFASGNDGAGVWAKGQVMNLIRDNPDDKDFIVAALIADMRPYRYLHNLWTLRVLGDLDAWCETEAQSKQIQESTLPNATEDTLKRALDGAVAAAKRDTCPTSTWRKQK
jgi:hypothetical protein